MYRQCLFGRINVINLIFFFKVFNVPRNSTIFPNKKKGLNPKSQSESQSELNPKDLFRLLEIAHFHWFFAASSTIRLISSYNTIEKELEPTVYDYIANSYGYRKFIECKDLFDIEKGYVKNDTIKY